MFELDKLYSGMSKGSDHPMCVGCTILEKDKPCHSILDYEKLYKSDVLFLSDSIRYSYAGTSAFSKKELDLISDSVVGEFLTAAAVKCPSVKEADMTPNNMNICRNHLQATIDKVKPKLVFTCGNLAMKMLIKKSGITTKRGKSFEYATEAGHNCVVVPIYHPYSCIKEPRHLPLFKKDISNAYEKYVLGKTSEGNFSFKVLMDIEDVQDLATKLRDTDETIAADLETTGLNFITDKIMTVAISTRDQTWVIPVDHKDSPHKGDVRLYSSLRRIFENPKNRKVFHNAKFDLKFLINYGVVPVNVWDTKIMHHLLDENMPKSLMDLTKLYFADELENL